MKFLFIVLLLLFTSGHSVLCYTDTCDYTSSGQQYLCGNICLNNGDLCECDDQKIIWGWSYNEYCCALSCTITTTGAKCSEGHVLDFSNLAFSSISSSPCNATGRCFNDFLTSQHLSFSTRYQCQDKCISPSDMMDSGVCQGVSLCPGDQEMCTPQLLRCPSFYSLHNMSTFPVRSYCYYGGTINYETIKNNGSYDLMDRSDKSLPLSNETSSKSINYTALTPCSMDYGPGGFFLTIDTMHKVEKSHEGKFNKIPPGMSANLTAGNV